MERLYIAALRSSSLTMFPHFEDIGSPNICFMTEKADSVIHRSQELINIIIHRSQKLINIMVILFSRLKRCRM
jgi:hypothetical protein